MKYALLGDIHSSLGDLKNVLTQIHQQEPDAILIGTGDIYECTISKKDITDNKFSNLADVMLNPEGFSDYLTFPSIKGNQEERILYMTETDDTLREEIQMMPEKMEIVNAAVIHGHQWSWGGTPWALQQATVSHAITFYGHSHQSGLMIDDKQQPIQLNKSYTLTGNKVLVNVGSVVKNQEWSLYNTADNTVTFKSARKS